MPFVKLDTGILDSTLWVERECREIFITALLLAEPFELKSPMDQYEVRTLEKTGYRFPPGWYGFVRAAGVGIIRRALVGVEEGMIALEKLCAPDPESRSPDFEGRRMARVDGGYLVINFMHYRDRDYTAAERQNRLRRRNAVREANEAFAEEWHVIEAFYGTSCAFCEEYPWSEIGYIVPEKMGGKRELKNIAPACRSCATPRRNKILEPKRRHPFMSKK